MTSQHEICRVKKEALNATKNKKTRKQIKFMYVYVKKAFVLTFVKVYF